MCHRWYHTFVDKTTVYLPIELKTALRRIALQRGVSEAEVIRESIRQAVMGEDRPRPSGGLYAGKAPIARAGGQAPARVRRAVIVDTSALLAYFDSHEPDHAAVAGVFEGSTEPLVVSPYVVAETDYLVATRHGTDAELAVLAELAGGAWELPAFEAADLVAARELIERYADQTIGVADASLVVLAARYRTSTIVTLDRRHFGVVRPLAVADSPSSRSPPLQAVGGRVASRQRLHGRDELGRLADLEVDAEHAQPRRELLHRVGAGVDRAARLVDRGDGAEHRAPPLDELRRRRLDDDPGLVLARLDGDAAGDEGLGIRVGQLRAA